MESMADIIEKKEEIGFIKRIQDIASRTAGFFGVRFYELYYVEKNLSDDIEKIALSIDLDIRKATDEDLNRIPRYLNNKDRENFEYNIAIKSTCYVAAHKDRIAGYSWASRRFIYIDGMILSKLPSGGSYNTDSYVFPEFRGNKIFQKLISAVYIEMKKSGCSFTSNIVATNNAPSIAARKRFGVTFQPTYILRLPGPVPLFIGKRFRMASSPGPTAMPNSAQDTDYNGKENEYWTMIAGKFSDKKTGNLWRTHSNSVNSALLDRRLSPGGLSESLLITDLFDALFDRGLLPILRPRCRNLFGMDISESVVNKAKRDCPDLHAAVADVRRLSFKGETFDTVVSLSTLDHFSKERYILNSLKEFHRTLKKGGRLILTIDNLSNPVIAIRNAIPFPFLNRIGVVPYMLGVTLGPKRLCRIVEQAGFKVIDVSPVMHCPRVVAVALSGILEKKATRRTQQQFLKLLMAFERLSVLPTRFLTGYFIAVDAVKH